MFLRTETPIEDKGIILALEDKGNNTVSVIDGESGWDIVTFRLQDGKLVFAKNKDIDDPYIDTDEDGYITEVNEYGD